MSEHSAIDTDSHELAVVDPADVRRDAYKRGYERFKEAPEEARESPAEAVSAFRDTARYVNIVAPMLRKRAGLTDLHGAGTYQGDREVRTPDGVDMSAQSVFGEAVDAWESGAADALEGEDKEPENIGL